MILIIMTYIRTTAWHWESIPKTEDEEIISYP